MKVDNQNIEIINQKRIKTISQDKNANLTREGVIVNSFVKCPNVNMDDIYDSMIISDDSKMPEKLYENEKRNKTKKSILPIIFSSVGIMTGVAGISAFIKKSAKANLQTLPWEKLPSLQRNLVINNETHQAIYQMVQCPNRKTTLAAMGVLTLSSMAFMAKNTIDGMKEVWLKKKDADIQKNLQEKLIAVETQSFSGKMQIIRSMLSKNASKFCKDLSAYPISFSKNSDKLNNEENSYNSFYLLTAIASVGAIILLSASSLKNLSKSAKYIENYVIKTKNKITEIVQKSTDVTKKNDKTNLKNMFASIDAKPEFISKNLSNLKWKNKTEKNEFIDYVIQETRKSTELTSEAIGGKGTPKPSFYSHVDDYRAHFYNWILNSENKMFRNLFLGITSLSALTYGGKILVESVKEYEVKKANANTEYELQKRLVSTELKNFKMKKDTSINPLIAEFEIQKSKGKPKQELKTIADNILFEIKNGPPFVYS